MIIRNGRIDITGDSGWLMDSFVPATDYRRGPTSDTIGVSGSAGRGLLAGRGSLDAIAVGTDATARIHDAHRLLLDTPATTDAAGRIHDAHRPVSDAPAVADGVIASLTV